VSVRGSRPLARRADLLKAYRARWECLRWTEVTRLPPMVLWIYHFAGDVLAYISMYRAPVVQCLRLPLGRPSVTLWEGCGLGLEHGIKTFSAYPEKNLAAVLEEWFVDGCVPSVIMIRVSNVVSQDTSRQAAHRAIGFGQGYRRTP
jgi:hypothetical protein